MDAVAIAMERIRTMVADMRCGWEGCPVTPPEPLYFYPLHHPEYSLCGKHLKALDPDYKRDLEMAEKEAKRFEQKETYEQVKALSHQEVKRPVFMKAGK